MPLLVTGKHCCYVNMQQLLIRPFATSHPLPMPLVACLAMCHAVNCAACTNLVTQHISSCQQQGQAASEAAEPSPTLATSAATLVSGVSSGTLPNVDSAALTRSAWSTAPAAASTMRGPLHTHPKQ